MVCYHSAIKECNDDTGAQARFFSGVAESFGGVGALKVSASGVRVTRGLIPDADGIAHGARLSPITSSDALSSVRRDYVKEIYQLEHAVNAMSEVGYQWEYIARRVSTMRVEIGKKYKGLTPFPQRAAIYARNVISRCWTFSERLLGGMKPQGYDSIYGPSVDWLRRNKGYSYEEIARKAADPNRNLNRSLGVEPNLVRAELGLPPLVE